MMITIKCRILYTTIIDIILLSIKKPTEHSMHVMQSSQKNNINSYCLPLPHFVTDMPQFLNCPFIPFELAKEVLDIFDF